MKRESQTSLVGESVRAILRNQGDNGAIVASPDFAQYNFCWLRDGSFSAYALDCAGEHEASALYHAWVNGALEGIASVIDGVIGVHQRGGELDHSRMPPARFALNGSVVVDEWPNFQIDGYGTWLWSLGQHLESQGRDSVPEELHDSVRRVARYLATFALSPCYDVWEENGNSIHTSTLACVYGGLATAGRLLRDDEFIAAAESVRSHVASSGDDAGFYVKSNTNGDVDASSLWLSAPFGVVDSSDEFFTKTVELIEDRLTLDGGIRRYGSDVYFGSGAWPVLTASLGWHYVEIGDIEAATRCQAWIESHYRSNGTLGEQYGGENRDVRNYRAWEEKWGPPAHNLMWSHAMYVVLSLAIESGRSALLSRVDRSGSRSPGSVRSSEYTT